MSFLRKEKETPPPVREAVEEVQDTGTAADVEEVMKKYDRESNTRIWTGKPALFIKILGIAFSCWCIFSTLKGWPTLPEQKLNIFVGLILIMGYLHYPIKKGITRANYIPIYDIAIMVVGAFPFFYFAANANTVIQMASRVTKETKWVVLAIIGILALMELCRRSVGIPILCVVGVLLVYTFSNVRFGKVIYDLFYTTTGLMNTPHQRLCQVHRGIHHLRRVPGAHRVFRLSLLIWPTAWPVPPPADPPRWLLFPPPCAAWCPAPRWAIR